MGLTQVRFLVRLRNDGKYTPVDKQRLTSLAYEAVRMFAGDIGNLRVSSSAVELDLLLDSKANLDQAIQALEREIGTLLTIRELDVATAPVENEDAVKNGIALFNDERYWESHEALEAAWRRSEGPEKEILQGLILLAAGLVHLQKNEHEIALSIVKRAYDKLVAHQGKHFGVDISAVKTRVAEMLSTGRVEFLKIGTGH